MLLKGSTTVVADPAARVRVNPTGTPVARHGRHRATCSPGSRARCSPAGSTRSTPASAGAYLHGLAGRLARPSAARPISAYDVIGHAPGAVRALTGG